MSARATVAHLSKAQQVAQELLARMADSPVENDRTFATEAELLQEVPAVAEVEWLFGKPAEASPVTQQRGGLYWLDHQRRGTVAWLRRTMRRTASTLAAATF